MTNPWLRAADDVLDSLDVRADDGLSEQEAHRRRRRHGPNRLHKTKRRAVWRILLDQFVSVVIVLLISAAAVAALLDRLVEAIAIAAAITLNTLIGFSMEWRATRSMEALQNLGETRARLRRGGRSVEVDAIELVLGDIVLLDAGDLVAADVRLIEVNQLQCNEAALTGESVPVPKQTEPLEGQDVAIGDRRNMAWKGTSVASGSGAGVVVATGMDTELGHVSRLAEEASPAATPLEKRLDLLGRRLVWLTLGMTVVLAAAGILAGKEPRMMLETAIALAIAAVPEGLPVVATLALARGMQRMARRNAVVKRLAAVEALGAADIIFTDKTGTLTENRMRVARLLLERGIVDVESDGDGEFRLDDEELTVDETPELRMALEIGALCNNASLDDDGASGDPTEIALLEAATHAGINREQLLAQYPEQREISFDPDVKMMATWHSADDRGYRIAVKGAPEAVLEVCSQVQSSRGAEAMEDAALERWRSQSDELASRGLRLMALAEKTTADENAEAYEALTLVALAGLHDPPREKVADTIAVCKQAGIRVIMGTGDHAATATAIARQIGLLDDDESRKSSASDQPLEFDTGDAQALLEQNVFARISPEQKLKLIALYQDNGHTVGMTGDGVNDGPALKKADIGIAMGKRGTEVAREAADMVLKDDAFETILAAIEHGRTIFANIRCFIVYLLSGNLGEIMAISAAALVAAPLPMLPLQILYINFVSDIMPALALGLSRGERDVLQRPPRNLGEPIVSRRHWLRIGAYGFIIAASVLSAFAIALTVLDMTAGSAVSIGFLTFGFARLWHVFNMRSPGSGLVSNEVTRNPYIWISILAGIALLLAASYLPPLADVLSVEPPDATGWSLCLAFSLLPLIAGQLMKAAGLWEELPASEGGQTKAADSD